MRFFIVLLLSFLAIEVAAQSDSIATKILEEAVVTGVFGEAEYKKVARAVQVITAKEIAEAPVKSLDGILQYAANVDVRSRGPLGVQADISIRGGHYDQTLIMLDGVKLNDPQTGHHSLNLPVALDMIERIEVLQGGASRVYGPSAFAGVINIVTKKVKKTGFAGSFVSGENGLKQLGGTVGLKLAKDFTLLINMDQMRSDGFAENTAFDKKSGFVKFDWNLNQKTNITGSAGTMKNDFGAANYYFPSVYTQYESVAAKTASLELNHDLSYKLSTKLMANYRRHNDAYDFNKYRLDATKINLVNYHQTDVWDVAWLNKLKTKLGQTTLGIEYRSEGVLSNRLGVKLANPTKRVKSRLDSGSEGIFYTNQKIRENTSVYLDQVYSKNRFTISTGTMLNVNSQFGTEFFPGVDFSYALGKNGSLYGSFNKSLRFPTFTEMYLNTSTVVADPNLKPEKASTTEVGFKSRNTGFSYGIAAFYKVSNAAIDKVKRPENAKPTMETIGDMDTYGAEFNAVLSPQYLAIGLPKFIKTIRANYAYIYSDKKEGGFQSFYTLNYLRHKANVGITFGFSKRLTLDTRYTFKSRLGTYQFKSTDPILPYKPIHLIDARLNYNLKIVRIFADGTNLFDKNYYEFGFVQQPGRWLSFGVNLNL